MSYVPVSEFSLCEQCGDFHRTTPNCTLPRRVYEQHPIVIAEQEEIALQDQIACLGDEDCEYEEDDECEEDAEDEEDYECEEEYEAFLNSLESVTPVPAATERPAFVFSLVKK